MKAQKNFIAARVLVLELLRQLGPTYGATLFKIALEQTSGAMELNCGSVYPAIKSLEKEKLIELDDIVQLKRGRPARIYSLTEDGAIQADETRACLAQLFMLKE